MASVTYLIRAIPLTLIRKEVKSNFIKSFLYYVPYVTLSIIIFPDILYSTNSIVSASIAFIIALVLSYKKFNMIVTSSIMCVVVYILENLIF